ncbi:MAG TPA: hypothetical protein VFB39_16720 [Solirubrobacteraceae bacterium]|nr:hypothetical protein [Solirubrobacteraceae bacterium]
MDVDAGTGAPGAAGHGDFDVGAAAVEEPMQGGGLAMAQDRARPGSEYGRHPVAFSFEQRGGGERVDAAVDAVEASALGAMLNCSSRQPEGRELIEGDDPVLS